MFKGRQFSGLLFVGRHFRQPQAQTDQVVAGGRIVRLLPRRDTDLARRKRRRRRDEDVLIAIIK